ncbi:MAG TPA: TIGR00701 family protein [Mariprofundaceae bacterium]|nr:TIGR00701 family protein [Mariprofundaceae bacterium]
MEWVKVFHIMMFTSWFAGLFYLPRLFVNHAMAESGAVQQQLAVMERKLYRFVTPMMWLTVLSGAVMAYDMWAYFGHVLWFWLKVGVVVLLVAYHFYCGHLVQVFAHSQNARSHVFYRFFNEIPVFGLVAVVIFVIVRPFL